MNKITKATVRMYRMGTGDCFILKFFSGEKEKFKMMIDCGTWSGSKDKLTDYISELKAYVNNHIDVLVVTHEHKDHVHGFDVCEELFTDDFKIDHIWMGWSEDDTKAKVRKWKAKFGDKKKALSLAANQLNDSLQTQRVGGPAGEDALVLHARQQYASAIMELDQLHNNVGAAGVYVGGLAGMEVVKKKLASGNIEYFLPGEVISNLPGLDGIKFYVLGPPENWENEVRVQEGKPGESYQHNKTLSDSDAFTAAVLDQGAGSADVMPFNSLYELKDTSSLTYQAYNDPTQSWRQIDADWLDAAGSLALRINSITNNLSLALAIEFEKSGKVLLFPGDAEYGSWSSWHEIQWTVPSRNKDLHFTADLLDRTVFYKVAHHLSHHGTAERLGMKLMNHPDLVAMATLDYDVISPKWLGTMPNYALLKTLVSKTKGRLMVMNEDRISFDKEQNTTLTKKLERELKKLSVEERDAFNSAFVKHNLYLQYTIDGL